MQAFFNDVFRVQYYVVVIPNTTLYKVKVKLRIASR